MKLFRTKNYFKNPESCQIVGEIRPQINWNSVTFYGLLFIVPFFLQSCCWFKQCPDPPTPKPDDNLPKFNTTPTIVYLNQKIEEISGIIPSYSFPHALWMMEDGGNNAEINLVNKDGKFVEKVGINVYNRDWEAIALGPGPIEGKNYIYIGDIGDNNEVYGEYSIHRFVEPEADQNYVDNIETIHFTYPGGTSYDAETLLVEPATKDIYIITKRQLNVKVFRLPYPQNTQGTTEAQFMGDIKFWGITTGNISQKGDEILLKSYLTIFYWKLKSGETLFQALSRTNDLSPPYVAEPQGESICWDLNGDGYYTISEIIGNPGDLPLYYYSKVKN